MNKIRVLPYITACIISLVVVSTREYDVADPLVFQKFVTSFDGTQINTVFIPAVNQKIDSPTILCAHGATHYIDKMRPTMFALAQGGYNVIGLDFRGHGKSGGQRGDMPSFNHLLNDLKSVYTEYKKYIRGQLFALGHSAGSLAIIRTLQHTNEIPIDAAVLISPCLGLNKNIYWGHRKALLPVLRSAYPTYDVPFSTREPRRFRPKDDALCLKSVTARSLHEVVKHSRYALRNPHKIASSIHILVPEHDDIVDNEKTKTFYRRLPSTISKSMSMYKDTHHSLLEMQDRTTIHQKILSLFDQHTAAQKKAKASPIGSDIFKA